MTINNTPTCERCGHPPDWHRLDSTTNVDPSAADAEFRCIGYDCMVDGPPGYCIVDCPDYVGALT